MFTQTRFFQTTRNLLALPSALEQRKYNSKKKERVAYKDYSKQRYILFFADDLI